MTQQRFDYLDSVRGLAAFCVLIFHLNAIEGEGALSADATRVYYALFNGHHATSLFFVLSGLVLSYKYLKMPELQLNYKHFILKRMYRLYPAYWISFLILYLSINRLHVFAKIMDVIDFIKEASLFRNINDTFGGGWTLNIEMGVSLLMPILILVMRHSRQWFWYLTLFSLLLSAYYTLFLFLFCLGVWIAADFDVIQKGKYRSHLVYRYRYALLPIWFLCFSGNYIFENYKDNAVFMTIRDLIGFDWHQLSGFVSFLLLIWIISSTRWQQLLRLKPLLFLGKISYSVYLMQWMVIFILVNPKYSWFKNYFQTDWLTTRLIMAFTAISLTLLLATLLYQYVERPFMKIAKQKFEVKN